ncbi:MAG: hypothetical protein R2716_06890 [Microthrixaceae bacterium]
MRLLPVRVLVLFAVAATSVVVGCGGSGTPPVPELQVVESDAADYDYDYVIPFGTGRRLDGGEEVEIVPAELDVKVGERIRIVNEDVRGAAVGIFWVPAERTVAMEFTTPGTLSGECDVHPSGVFTINVTEA